MDQHLYTSKRRTILPRIISECADSTKAVKNLCAKLMKNERNKERQAGQDWIKFENLGATSAPSWILGAVVDRILAKSADYEERNLHVRHSLDELHLVCRYSEQALLADVAPGFSRFDFAGFALRVRHALANEHGVFNRIFLFNSYQAQKVFQVYPTV